MQYVHYVQFLITGHVPLELSCFPKFVVWTFRGSCTVYSFFERSSFFSLSALIVRAQSSLYGCVLNKAILNWPWPWKLTHASWKLFTHHQASAYYGFWGFIKWLEKELPQRSVISTKSLYQWFVILSHSQLTSITLASSVSYKLVCRINWNNDVPAGVVAPPPPPHLDTTTSKEITYDCWCCNATPITPLATSGMLLHPHVCAVVCGALLTVKWRAQYMLTLIEWWRQETRNWL